MFSWPEQTEFWEVEAVKYELWFFTDQSAGCSIVILSAIIRLGTLPTWLEEGILLLLPSFPQYRLLSTDFICWSVNYKLSWMSKENVIIDQKNDLQLAPNSNNCWGLAWTDIMVLFLKVYSSSVLPFITPKRPCVWFINFSGSRTVRARNPPLPLISTPDPEENITVMFWSAVEWRKRPVTVRRRGQNNWSFIENRLLCHQF